MDPRRKLRQLVRDPLGALVDSRRLGALSPRLVALAERVADVRNERIARDLFDVGAHEQMWRAAAGRYAYLPWIAEHGDALLNGLDPDGDHLVPWRLFRGTGRAETRGLINRFAREKPDVYRRILLQGLTPVRDQLRGMVFTLDWPPAMRQAVHACRELAIPTVLVLHEGVFADPAHYYVDPFSGVDVPGCDLVLCWGMLHQRIFSERGIPPERLRIVGSAKLDASVQYRPRLSDESYAALYGFDPAVPIVLFAMQPPDFVSDSERARAAQNEVIADLLELCVARRLQLIVRHPPSGHRTLTPQLLGRLRRTPRVAVDTFPCAAGPSESLSHCRVVVSVNSTMLLEAALMGRAAVSAHYLHVPSSWSQAGIPVVRGKAQLATALDSALASRGGLTSAGRTWAEQAYSAGTFDGCTNRRIREVLDEPLRATLKPPEDGRFVGHLFQDRVATCPYGTAAFHRAPTKAMGHVEAMLGFGRMLSEPGLSDASTADVFVKWGITKTPQKERQDRLARRLNRPQIIIEDGFLRSVDIGLSGEPGLSLIVDTKTAYYDATRPSRLEDRLNGPDELTPVQHSRAERCMQSIRHHRLSKYNHAPDTPRTFGPGPRILVVDQRVGDESIRYGLAGAGAFASMVEDALRDYPGHSVVIKRHPDATRGGKSSHFDADTLRPSLEAGRIVLVDGEVHPHALFDQVEEVFVVTSGMGFEALIAGRRVRCYGAPFYAGWGLTDDRITVPRRRRSRTLTDVFHCAYVESSRYYSPALGRAAEIEDVIDYLSTRRRALGMGRS